MSNMPRGTFMQVMEKYTKSLKAFISAQGFGHYSKPSGGIPKTDLDQSVQTSLGKADTALQGFTETDPTVPAWAKASSKPSYTASEVGLGKVGNFKAVSTEASQGLSNTEKANARTNIGAGTSSFSGSYNDLSDKPTIPTKVSQLTNDSGYTANTGTVTGVKVGSTSYSPSSGVVSLPAYPTTLPASDVSSWAKASTKPSYTASEVGLGNVGNFKAVSTVASQGLSDTEKANARTNIGGGTYSKPSGGIPKTDLASAVQTSLGKADSALQSETDPTVPAWAKASTKPSYTASEVGLGNVGNFKAVSTVASQGLSDTEKSNARANIGAGTGNGTYSKPSGGIPKTDLASAVQTSLGKADSALQAHQTIKQDGVTGATVNRFGTCSTAAATAAKTVSVTSGTFSLEAGARVSVKFTNVNTADTPTLNVNSTGAKNIYSKGSQITTGSNKSLLAGTVDFIYDGTQWHLIGNYIDTNTTYSAATTSAAGLMSATDKTKLDGIATGANNYTHPTSTGNKHIPSGGSSGQILRWSANGTAAWGSDNNTWTAMVGATSSANGSVGYVNAVPPKDGYNTKYLRADGSWQVPPNTTYSSKSAASGGTDVSLCTTGEKYTWNNKGTYSKPSGGIPKTDLASAVQTSLGLADGSLQHTTVSGSPDLDTYLTTGVYHIATQTATHAPTTNHATLFVDATVGTPYQIFKPDSSDTVWYTRHRSGSAWTAWVAMQFTDTVYSHPTTAGNKHIPSGGSAGKILVYGGSSGTASWGDVPCSVINPSDFFTPYGGGEVLNTMTKIFKQGRHIFGLVGFEVKSTDPTIGYIKTPYLPAATGFFGIEYAPNYSTGGMNISFYDISNGTITGDGAWSPSDYIYFQVDYIIA